MRAKTIGVLGGMGPESTVLFFKKLVQLSPAQTDQEHIPIIIYNNPQIPDRTKAILNQGEGPLTALRTSIAVLQNAGSDFICIPCNTAHYYFDELQESCSVPIINMINTLVEFSLSRVQKIQKIGLLATMGTIRAGLYQDAFREHNIEVLTPEGSDLDDLQNCLYRIKSHTRETHELNAIAERMVGKGIQCLVLGCTELSLVMSDFLLDVEVLDSTDTLARKAVQMALQN